MSAGWRCESTPFFGPCLFWGSFASFFPYKRTEKSGFTDNDASCDCSHAATSEAGSQTGWTADAVSMILAEVVDEGGWRCGVSLLFFSPFFGGGWSEKKSSLSIQNCRGPECLDIWRSQRWSRNSRDWEDLEE